MQVADFASPENLDAIVSHGWAGTVRYVSDYPWKNITKGEFDATLARGLSITLVCEQGAQPALRGASGGAYDSGVANRMADAVGYDTACTLMYVAEDPNRLPQAAWDQLAAMSADQQQALVSWQWAMVEQYFEALTGRASRGAYGGWALVNHLITTGRASHGWTVQTWGGCHGDLCQLVGANTFGMGVDVNDCLVDNWGQHPPHGTPTPPPPPPAPSPVARRGTGWFRANHPTVQQGAAGATVAHAQTLLGGLIADGSFGPKTRARAVAWQHWANLNPDGVVGPQTWSKLHPILKQGATGPYVREVQAEIVGVGVDGVDGPATTAAVRDFQATANIGVDGQVGPDTYLAFFGPVG